MVIILFVTLVISILIVITTAIVFKWDTVLVPAILPALIGLSSILALNNYLAISAILQVTQIAMWLPIISACVNKYKEDKLAQR